MSLNVDHFEEIKTLDNFYQTSSFYPMPVVAISTLSENGMTNVGPYSLVFPYYIAGKDYYSILLLARNNSNTSINILRTGICALNFIPDNQKFMKECVRIGFPGETTEEKMKDSIFTLEDGLRSQRDHDGRYPKIITEAFQVFECTWMSNLENADIWLKKRGIQTEGYEPPYNNFNGITSQMGAHFILRVENILIKPEYKKAILEGLNAKSFPNIPIDYGYRDNTNFWFQSFSKPYPEKIPESKAVQWHTVKYAADRLGTNVKFTEEACAKLVKVPRVFLKAALKGCVEWADKNGVTILTAEHMDQIRDKRNSEKK